MQTKVLFLATAVAVLASGCSVQKRTLMPGWHVERAMQALADANVEATMAALDDSPKAEVWEHEVLKTPHASHRPPSHPTTNPVALQSLSIDVPREIRQSPRSPHLVKKQSHDTTIQLDRDAELTLTLVGAALLMWGYMPFSIIGFLVVFLASIVGAPLVHALIWGEKMDWGKSRLGRLALSLVLSGLVLTGAVALVADILGLVF